MPYSWFYLRSHLLEVISCRNLREFIGVALANELFFQRSWQVLVSVKKGDIEIGMLQIPQFQI